MPAQTHYFKLGLFLLVGFLLTAAAAVYFGAGTMFTNTLTAESYFKESVQGLSIGSPVKYRGVKIGSVASIGFLASKYPDARDEFQNHVLVEMDLLLEKGLGNAKEVLQKRLQQQVRRGLKVRLTSQGLTGIVYLEADFYNGDNATLPDFGFTPKALYIPSTPSTMQRVEAALSNIGSTLSKLEQIDYVSIGRNANELLENLNETLLEADVERLGELTAQNLEELRSAIQRVNELLSQPELEHILPDLAATVATSREIAEEAKTPVSQGIQDLRQAAGNLKSMSRKLDELATAPGLREGVKALPDLLYTAQNATQQLARSGERLEELLASLRRLTVNQRDVIEAILREAQATLMNLSDITEDATRDPSRLLLGAPPKPLDPGARTGPATNPEAP